MSIQTCFILGSGSSLLKLTKRERDFVNSSDLVLAFNKYLIFSELVGIKPTHYLLGDQGPKADLMLTETARICRSNYTKMHFILSKYYQQGTPEYDIRKARIQTTYSKLNPATRWLKNRRDDSAINQMSKSATYIERYDWLEGGRWGRTLNDKIFHYRGSLSGAINVVNIIHPGRDIKLLGVDLDDHAYFFQEQLQSNPEKWGVFLSRLTPGETQHETAIRHKGNDGIQKMFPYIIEQVAQTGGRLLCSNPHSLLVKEGIVPYSGVEETR